MNTYSIWQTDKVRLRAVEPGDAGVFHEWSLDDENARNSYEIPFPESYAQVKSWVENKTSSKPVNDSFRWSIVNDEDQLVGTINTFACRRREGTFKYGIAIIRDYWGRGYAKDAIRLVLRYFFHELNYQKANASVYSFNQRSIRLHESLGFQKEGQLRRMIYTDGSFHDEWVFGLLREEFERIHADWLTRFKLSL